MAQGDCNEDEEAESANSKASSKILVAEDVPWEDFVEVNFGRSAGQEKRERGRVAAVHIQRILRGYLVGWMLCHTSHVTRHTSHVTRRRCGSRDPKELFSDVYGQGKEGCRMLLLFCSRYNRYQIL